MEAGLSPQAIATKDFRLCRRGFSPEEVSEFLADVAGAYQQALDLAAANEARAERAEADVAPRSFEELGAEAGALLRTAREGADAVRRRAEEDAAALMARATEEVEKARREVTLENDRLRNATRRQCEEMIADAQARADRLAAQERQLRERLHEVEKLFLSFREGVDTPASEQRDDPSFDGSPSQDPAEVPARPDKAVAT